MYIRRGSHYKGKYDICKYFYMSHMVKTCGVFYNNFYNCCVKCFNMFNPIMCLTQGILYYIVVKFYTSVCSCRLSRKHATQAQLDGVQHQASRSNTCIYTLMFDLYGLMYLRASQISKACSHCAMLVLRSRIIRLIKALVRAGTCFNFSFNLWRLASTSFIYTFLFKKLPY